VPSFAGLLLVDYSPPLPVPATLGLRSAAEILSFFSLAQTKFCKKIIDRAGVTTPHR